MGTGAGDLTRAAAAALDFYRRATTTAPPAPDPLSSELYIYFNPWLARVWLRLAGRRVCLGGASSWRCTDPAAALAPLLQRLPGVDGLDTINVTYFGPPIWSSSIQSQIQRYMPQRFGFHCPDTCPPSERVKRAVIRLLRQAAPAVDTNQRHALHTALQRLVDPLFRVAVVATMSSGKSTLINALMGQELLPVANESTTAKPCFIHDHDNTTGFRGDALTRGGRLKHARRVHREQMEQWNQDDVIRRIDLEGDIQRIANLPHGRLVLIDTPGPNSVNNPSHRKELEDLLFRDHAERPDLVLYVLDATRVETADDHVLLTRVSQSLSAKDSLHQDRLIFALNRADLLDPEREPLQPRLERVGAYLSEQFKIDRPRLTPVDARGALLIVRHMAGQTLSRRDRLLYCMAQEASLELTGPPHWFQQMRWALLSQEQAIDEELLSRTGLPQLQRQLSSWLRHFALDLRIREALDTLERTRVLKLSSPFPEHKLAPAGFIRTLEQHLTLG